MWGGGSGGGGGTGGSGGGVGGVGGGGGGAGGSENDASGRRSQYETEVNQYLEDVIRDFSDRDTETIGTHLDTIRQALGKDAESSIELRYGGSIKKHTYVDGLSDVDSLVVVNGSDLESKTPKEVIHDFAEKIRARLPYTEVKEGDMAVTVGFTDGTEVQVLPAIRTATGLRVASKKGEEWSNVTNPDKFAAKLTAANQAMGGKLVKVIRLFKAEVNSKIKGGWDLSGYHIEALAIDAFTNYQGRATYKDMLMHLTKHASDAVLEPTVDTTGQSIHVDNELGPRNSMERRMASAALQRELAKMRDADSAASMKRWKELMGD